MGQSFSYLLLYYSLSKEILYPFIDSFCIIFMNNIMKGISALVIIALIAVIMSSILSPFSTPMGFQLRDCEVDGEPLSPAFSEFKQENNSGIYTTELLEFTNESTCTSKWENFYIHLVDLEGKVTNFSDSGRNLIASYEGNTTLVGDYYMDIASRFSNDTNGSNYPIRILDNITSNGEEYITERHYDYDSDSMINTTYLHPKLSVGDKIRVYGSGSEADGPAGEGWLLRIIDRYDGTTISEIKIA